LKGASSESLDLPVLEQLDCFNAFRRSFGSIKGLEALRGPRFLLNETMVLHDDVI
jgi:hypothetical protein